jgi:CHAD domain-containing protein
MTATAEPVEVPPPPPPIPPAGTAAHAAISDIGRKFRRNRRRFIERQDAESLHDLRVSLRRLRAVLTLFRPVVVLPRRLADRDLRRAGHELADLRDQDVALEAIQAQAEEATGPRPELKKLERRRQREAYRVAERLRGPRVRSMLRALRRWDQAPSFAVEEDTPVTVVLPGLRSRVAAIELHPAWSLALVPDDTGGLHASDSVYDDQTTADLLHQLRRRIKQVRYQLEATARVLGADWLPALERMRVLQESLGVMQDVRMLGALTSVPHDRIVSASAAWEEMRGERLGGVRALLDGR